MKIIQNRTRKSESGSESEDGEINEENCFEMENPQMSQKNGYRPINTNPDHELNLHTDGETPRGENENKYLATKYLPLEDLTKNAYTRIDTE